LCQSGNYGIIYVTEAAAVFLDKEIAKYRSEPSPAIILIPGVSGNTGEGLSAVRMSVEKAVGSDIFNE
ncbi:MAG: V-type ATP synthase subunit F, partial [Ruminococcus sp.]|nr:V-type ATP synthase subunit F [Ruminococcus sp.]